MVDLKEFVQNEGFSAIHIKTDSIKIPDATPEIIQKVTEFGAKYGYTFEHESTYDKFCLVNKAVYIAREGDHWEAVGAEFQHPYVFKKLFTREEITFDDYVETRQVTKGSIYLADPDLPEDSDDPIKGGVFVGRIGTFVPVRKDTEGAGRLVRALDGKAYAVAGTKGHLWAKEAVAREQGLEVVDTSYAENLANEAIKQLETQGTTVEELHRA